MPTRDELSFNEVDLEEPQFVRETIDHSVAPSALPGTVVNPLRITSRQIFPARSGQDMVFRGSVIPVGEWFRSALHNADSMTEGHRVVGKRAIMPPEPLA